VIAPEDQTSHLHHARCPRCGYEQRGVIDTWKDTCPLEGTCSECGLQWSWAEVIHPEKFEPPWSVEFVRRLRSVPWAAIRTAIHSLWPWRFWRSMRMSQPIRWRRLAMYIFLWLVVPSVAAYVLAQGSVATYVRWWHQRQIDQMVKDAPVTLRQKQAILASLEQQAESTPSSSSASTVPPEVYVVASEIGMLQALIATPPSISHSYLSAIYEALVLPAGTMSSGTITYNSTMYPYVAPRELWTVAKWLWTQTPNGGSQSSSWQYFDLSASTGAMAWGCLLMLMLPGSLVLLPASRRKAKVGWGHIVRVTVYGMPWAMVVFGICAVCWATAMLWDSSWTLVGPLIQVLSVAGLPALLVVWWAVAIKRYLRMPHGAAIAVLMTILCVLLSGSLVATLAMAVRSVFA
jgi:hypothetical protein